MVRQGDVAGLYCSLFCFVLFFLPQCDSMLSLFTWTVGNQENNRKAFLRSQPQMMSFCLHGQ